MRAIERARAALQGGVTLAAVRGEEVLPFYARGIRTLLCVAGDGTQPLKGCAVADKIVGRAAALLLVLAGVCEVYGEVMSRGAADVLAAHGVPFSCGTETDVIINRAGTGMCPMEEAVAGIRDAAAAYQTLRNTLSGGGTTMKKLGFGCMRLPVIGGDQKNIDLPAFERMADAFLARGFTYFDTAYVYHGGRSEEAVREAVVKRYPRDAFTVTTKLYLHDMTSPGEMEQMFSEQLTRLGVEYVDYYLVHALNAALYDKAQRLGAFAFVAKKQAEGKIRHIGFSFHDSPELLERILTDHPETECVQLQINYVDWESPTIAARRCYEVAAAHGKPVIVMEPLKGGALVNVPEEVRGMFASYAPARSVASWGIRFAASLPNVLTVLSGMSNLGQTEDNLSYMQEFEPLTKEEEALCGRAAEIIRAHTPVPCTACRYCTDGCPKRIAIPEYFALYNEHERMAGRSNGWLYYQNLARQYGKASECIGCGKCEKVCPQHLPIRRYLKEVVKSFE